MKKQIAKEPFLEISHYTPGVQLADLGDPLILSLGINALLLSSLVLRNLVLTRRDLLGLWLLRPENLYLKMSPCRSCLRIAAVISANVFTPIDLGPSRERVAHARR